MKKWLIGLTCVGMWAAVAMSASGGLIISQYYEGASNNKWIEIYNPGPGSVDLIGGGYRLGRWDNANNEAWKAGTAPGNAIILSNSIAAGATYLVRHSSAVLPAYAAANQDSTQLTFNGNDSVVLYTGATYAFANVVDAFGLGVAFSNATDRSYVRKTTVTTGVNTDFNAADWDEFTLAAVEAAAESTNERLGYHNTGGEPPPATTNVKFYASGAMVNEDQGTVAVTVYKTLPEGNVSGQIALSGTATYGGGADYTVDTTNFTMNGATTSAVITVTINDDADPEAAETVVMDFANVVGAGTTAPAAFTLTINASDVPAEGIVDFRFNAVPYLQATAKDANLAVSDMALSSGTIETAVDTGTYFTDEPYVEETGGWAVDNQAGAKAFQFTITPAVGASMTINGISFKAYATAAGPSAYGFDVGGGMATHEVNAPSNALLVVSQAVAGVVSQTGAIVVKIQGWANGSRETAGTGAFRLDDVVIHGSVSTGPLEYSVSFNKTSGFTVEEGTSDAIVATAANGIAPYTYGWSSTLGGAFYAADTNVFTILATAPIGAYTSTVVATDSDAPTKRVTNSLTFSVVAPAVKYAIAIVTNNPGEGTVTTAPATEAAAGVTVTVTATPAEGYAVESIVVNGGAVAVSGSGPYTFTMPAAPATVTATFVVFIAPDAFITFETGTLPSAYSNNTALLEDGKIWSTMRVVKGNLDNDKKIGTLSGRLYPVTGTNAVLQQTEAYAEPITKLSFSVASYGTDNMANVVLTAEVSTDGSSWEAVKTLSGAADITATMTEHVVETIPANAVYARFVVTAAAASGKRVNIDNVGFDFGAPVFGVSLNKSNGFTVNEGSSDSITATAANGTEPYGYSWETTMGVGDYSTAGNVFMILATAPPGSFSATVTATDATLATAQRTVTFSVVGLNPEDPAVVFAGSQTGTVGVEMVLAVTVTNATVNEPANENWEIIFKNSGGTDVDWTYDNFPPTFAFTPAAADIYTLTAIATTDQGALSNTVQLTVSGGGGDVWNIGDGSQGSAMFTTLTNIIIVLPTNYTLSAVFGSDASPAGLNNLGQGLGTLTPDIDYTWTPATRTVTILNSVTNRRMIRIGANPP